MKNYLMLALFCCALFSNATNKIKSNIEITEEGKSVIAKLNEINNTDVAMLSFETTPVHEDVVGCGSQANDVYDQAIANGHDHRGARAIRRAWVRKCRGNGPNGWLGVCISFLHGCKR